MSKDPCAPSRPVPGICGPGICSPGICGPDIPRRSRLKSRAAPLAAALIVMAGLASPLAAFEALEFRFDGTDTGLETELRRASLLRTAQSEGVTDPFEIFTIARAEYGQLIGIFYEAGFYAPTISVRIDGREAADISPLNPPGQIRAIELTLGSGPRFTFGRADLGPISPQTDLPPDFQTGEVARSTVIRDATGAAIDGWRDAGHPLAEPAGQQITARHPANILDVAVQISPGPRLNFGALRPDGQRRTRPSRIVAIAGLPTGQIYSPDDLDRAANRLRRTGTFSSVALRVADTPNPDGSIDVTANVVEAPRRRIGAGIEFDTERGGKLSAFGLHRNLFRGAERLRIEGTVGGLGARSGGVDYRLSLDFARPATITPDTSLTLGAVIETEREDDFRARRARLDIGLEQEFSDTLTLRGGVGFLLERADFGPGFDTRRDFRAVLLPFGATWDRRDDLRNPTAGFFLDGDVTPFLGFGGADSGARIYGDARSYLGLGEDDSFVLAGRAQIGAVLAADLIDTPRNFLFNSGGSGTVRGQPFRSLGVTVDGIESGGQGFAALSGELRARATDLIGIVAFADAGYVSERAFSGQSDWHAGAGLGLRYDTPIGPLRLDVGFPVRGTTGSGAQLSIGIGHAF
ncbi:MAG: autotransporter assembly complex protein TamA [Roseinatronobacter sp.]